MSGLPRRLVVSGGASGIGAATCAIAARDGASIVVLDRDASRVDPAIASGIACDVTDEAAVIAAVDEACVLLGGAPDGVLCAAGVYDVVPSLDITAQRFLDVLSVNTLGSFLVARESVRHMASDGVSGAVVLIASMASESGDLREPAAHYAASKGAIVSMTRQLAVEWAELGVRVNAVSPGVIRTPMLRLTDDPEATSTYLATSVPLHRLGEADDVAQACLYLLGPAASYITGAVVPVDGGATVS
jgi:NAD(P)-dependent dehydrogenase (short-subunit alcohol dehydrogenase family)